MCCSYPSKIVVSSFPFLRREGRVVAGVVGPGATGLILAASVLATCGVTCAWESRSGWVPVSGHVGGFEAKKETAPSNGRPNAVAASRARRGGDATARPERCAWRHWCGAIPPSAAFPNPQRLSSVSCHNAAILHIVGARGRQQSCN
jgi:hypothetical protein